MHHLLKDSACILQGVVVVAHVPSAECKNKAQPSGVPQLCNTPVRQPLHNLCDHSSCFRGDLGLWCSWGEGMRWERQGVCAVALVVSDLSCMLAVPDFSTPHASTQGSTCLLSQHTSWLAVALSWLPCVTVSCITQMELRGVV